MSIRIYNIINHNAYIPEGKANVVTQHPDQHMLHKVIYLRFLTIVTLSTPSQRVTHYCVIGSLNITNISFIIHIVTRQYFFKIFWNKINCDSFVYLAFSLCTEYIMFSIKKRFSWFQYNHVTRHHMMVVIRGSNVIVRRSLHWMITFHYANVIL